MTSRAEVKLPCHPCRRCKATRRASHSMPAGVDHAWMLNQARRTTPAPGTESSIRAASVVVMRCCDEVLLGMLDCSVCVVLDGHGAD